METGRTVRRGSFYLKKKNRQKISFNLTRLASCSVSYICSVCLLYGPLCTFQAVNWALIFTCYFFLPPTCYKTVNITPLIYAALIPYLLGYVCKVYVMETTEQ